MELFGTYTKVGSGRLLGGSWVVISGVIGRVTIIITHIRELITPFITTHEPPSNVRIKHIAVQMRLIALRLWQL